MFIQKRRKRHIVQYTVVGFSKEKGQLNEKNIELIDLF